MVSVTAASECIDMQAIKLTTLSSSEVGPHLHVSQQHFASKTKADNPACRRQWEPDKDVAVLRTYFSLSKTENTLFLKHNISARISFCQAVCDLMGTLTVATGNWH